MKPILDIIVVTYDQNHELKCFIESILAQTEENWRMLVIHDGPSVQFGKIMEAYLDDPRIDYMLTDKRYNDWGHSLRKIGVERLGDSEYTLVTNADNYYAPVFIKEMCHRKADLVYCDLVHSHWGYQARESRLRRRAVDCGNVIIRTELLKRVGWNHFDYAADWHVIEECLETEATVQKVNACLFVHN